MASQDETYRYDPLDRRTFEAIAYNAVGRGSEINTLPAYHLTHSVGMSGWSVGLMQWDLGQEGRRDKVPDLLSGYQAWASEDRRFTDAEVASLTARLQTPGQRGNALSSDEHSRLDDYLRSDAGRGFVDGLDREQIAYKWDNVGQPLSQIPWLQEMSRNDPAQAAEVVAMASKRFNQGETRGRELIRHLQEGETTATALSDWIADVSARAPANRDALISGRDNVLSAVRLMNTLELGDGPLSRLWREEVHSGDNASLSRGFNFNPSAQLFDAMMRSPDTGMRILERFGVESSERSIVITGSNADARREMARVELSNDGVLNLRDTRTFDQQLTGQGWRFTNPPETRRQVDTPDHTGPGMQMPSASLREGPPSDPGHPDHGLLLQIRAGVRNTDPGVAGLNEEASERISRSLLAACKDNRERYPGQVEYSLSGNALNRIDHVVIGASGNIFAVEGRLDDPASKRAWLPLEQASRTPVEQSDKKLEAANQALAQEQTQQQHQALAREQNGPARMSPAMS